MWVTVRSAVLRTIQKIPILNTFIWFDSRTRWSALWKFLSLWMISILPLLLAGLNTKVPNGIQKQQLFDVYRNSVITEFSSTSLFIYSASYLAPFIYTIFVMLGRLVKYAFSQRKAPESLRFPDGYLFLLVVSAILFCITVFIYKKEGGETIAAYIADGPAKWWIYAYSLMCWYFTIMIESDPADAAAETLIAKQKQTGTELQEGLKNWAERGEKNDSK